MPKINSKTGSRRTKCRRPILLLVRLQRDGRETEFRSQILREQPRHSNQSFREGWYSVFCILYSVFCILYSSKNEHATLWQDRASDRSPSISRALAGRSRRASPSPREFSQSPDHRHCSRQDAASNSPRLAHPNHPVARRGERVWFR
jgi:hypothetical protein